MNVDKEVFDKWQKQRYFGCVKDLAEHCKVNEKAIYFALNKGEVNKEGLEEKITAYLNENEKYIIKAPTSVGSGKIHSLKRVYRDKGMEDTLKEFGFTKNKDEIYTLNVNNVEIKIIDNLITLNQRKNVIKTEHFTKIRLKKIINALK